MASESSIDGNYAPHQGYGSLDQNHTSYASANSNSNHFNAASQTTAASATDVNSSSASDIPKDEVGWYFVEQYYTTLSRSPEKLFVSCCRFPALLPQHPLSASTNTCPAVLQQAFSIRVRQRDGEGRRLGGSEGQ